MGNSVAIPFQVLECAPTKGGRIASNVLKDETNLTISISTVKNLNNREGIWLEDIMGNFQFQSKQHTMQKSKGFSNFCRVRRVKNLTRSYNRKALAVPKNQPNASVGTIIRGGSINIYFEEARGRSFPIEDRRGMCQWGVRAIILKINEVLLANSQLRLGGEPESSCTTWLRFHQIDQVVAKKIPMSCIVPLLIMSRTISTRSQRGRERSIGQSDQRAHVSLAWSQWKRACAVVSIAL